MDQVNPLKATPATQLFGSQQAGTRIRTCMDDSLGQESSSCHDCISKIQAPGSGWQTVPDKSSNRFQIMDS